MERLAEVRLWYSESLEVLSLAVHLPVLERGEVRIDVGGTMLGS